MFAIRWCCLRMHAFECLLVGLECLVWLVAGVCFVVVIKVVVLLGCLGYVYFDAGFVVLCVLVVCWCFVVS